MSLRKPPSEGQLLDTVYNTLRILKCFSIETPLHRVTELAETLGLNKSSVSRILSTLAAEGFVVKDVASRAYHLGPSALSLGNAYKVSNTIYKEAKLILRSLSEQVGETAQLAILDGMEVFFIESIESNHPLRYMAAAGSWSPLHCSSSGKVLLAFSDESLIDKVIGQGLPPWTNRTITDARTFREELSRIRKQGFALSVEEKYEGVIAIAAPVRNYANEAIASVNIVGPSHRMRQENLNRCIRHLVRAAAEISKSCNDKSY